MITSGSYTRQSVHSCIRALVCREVCCISPHIVYSCLGRTNKKTLKPHFLHCGATFVGIYNVYWVCTHIPPSSISLSYSASDRSRLRLAAASGLLKLAQNSHYQDLITVEQFQRLALTMQVGLSKGSSLSWTLYSDEIMLTLCTGPKDSFN